MSTNCYNSYLLTLPFSHSKLTPNYKLTVNNLDETSENVMDDVEEKRIPGKGRISGHSSSIHSLSMNKNQPRKASLKKTESEILREEIAVMRKEQEKMYQQMKDLRDQRSQESESKYEHEQSLLNEMKYLNTKVKGEDTKTIDLYSDTRSNYDPGFNLDEVRRDSVSKPLSEFGESTVSGYGGYSLNRPIRKRHFK